MAGISSTLPKGTILSDRYRVIQQIGQGGFGRTYLAEDIHRYNEKCVLKEFAPLVENDADLRKAEELFEREAGILYRLKHPRIPEFRALLRTRIDRKKTLFLVQEYVPGKTYYDLLKERGKFTESEVLELIVELLPVLEYIHQQNLIHRDISPDNLIYHQDDCKPVLIDFGCVKLAANAVSRSQGHSITLIGKKGYAPEEQMRNGSAFPNSDLYALAATAITLLTGKSPDRLYDAHLGKWHWEEEVAISSHLTKVLNKMLAYRASDRYQSATEVAHILSNHRTSLVNACISKIRTLIVAPKQLTINSTNEYSEQPATVNFVTQVTSQINRNLSRIKTKTVTTSKTLSRAVSSQIDKVPYVRKIRPWQWAAILIATATLPGIIAFSTTRQLLFFTDKPAETTINRQEIARQKKIYQRVEALDINSGLFFELVDREFYRRYPEFKNTPLTDSFEHHQYRQIWYQIAEEILQEKEAIQ